MKLTVSITTFSVCIGKCGFSPVQRRVVCFHLTSLIIFLTTFYLADGCHVHYGAVVLVFPVSQKAFLKVDVLDYPDRIEVQAALPAGVNKDAVELSINNQVLTIRASSKEEKEEGKYFRKEITRGEFQRTLSLPENVDENKVTASCQDGILKVSIQKTEKSKPKTIEIS